MDNRIPLLRNRAHWTPRYIYNRLLLMRDDFLNPDWPMLTKDAIKWLDSHLNNNMMGAEFGGGRSTLWLAKRVAFLYSIEHDPQWVKKASNVSNIMTSNFPPAARQWADKSLDFALVDGLDRDQCALIMIDKLKSGGILVVDDIERYLPSKSKTFGASLTRYASSTWATFYAQVVDWKCIWTTNGIRDTVIWVKP